MDNHLKEVQPNFDLFCKAFKHNDFKTCTEILPKLKAMLQQLRSLPLYEYTPHGAQTLAIAHDIYEHAVVLSLKIEDEDAFERDFLELKQFYYDALGPPSPQEDPILALNLLRLLVQNRTDEFHSELELLSCLSPSALNNPCVQHAVASEQSLHEGGAYASVAHARQTLPDGGSSTYTYATYFTDLLQKSIRNNAGHPEGDAKEDALVLQKAKESGPCKEIPSLPLINQMLSLARISCGSDDKEEAS